MIALSRPTEGFAEISSKLFCGFSFLTGLLADEAALKGRKSSFTRGREPRGKHSKGFGAAGALLVLLTMFCGVSRADEPVYDIDIPSMNAAAALNRFAEQTGAIMLFPYDLARGRWANAVRGRYTLLEGLELLLQDTGLSGGLSDKRVVNISHTGNKQRLGEEGAMLEQKASLKTRIAAFVASIFSVSAASGQDTDAGATSLEEIIVTATKRAENVQDVPISIAVVTADDIDRRGLVHAEDYLRGIPGVNQVGGPGAYGGQAIVIRGMETSLRPQNFFSGPTTATYFGEAPTTNSAGLVGGSNIDIKLVDIQRVEVLRGPQGTAFGSSSMGGVVRTIPVAPKLDRFEGKLAAGYSVTSGTGGDNYNVQAVANVPLVQDKLAIRATGYQYQDSGYYRNRAASNAAYQAFVTSRGARAFAIDEEEVGAYYVIGGRIAALFQASNDLRFTLSYLKQNNESDGFALANSGTYEQTILRVAPEHVRRGHDEGISDYSIDIANAVTEYDLGWADFLATYSYIKGEADYILPQEANGLLWAASSDRPMDHRAQVGEIRLATKLDGAWNFLAGVYGEDLSDEYGTEIIWHGNPAANNACARCAGQRFLFDYLNRRELRQKAAFGEVSWQFLSGFELTGGVRAYEYDRTIRIDQSGPLVGRSTSRRDDSDASGSNFRANLSYKPNDSTLLYAGWAQGFRLGRPQPPLPAATCDANSDGIVDGTNVTIASLGSTGSVDSDSVDSYELGGKFSLLSRRLTIDVAIFRMDWSDIPVGRTLPCAFSYLTNAGKAQSDGVEFQANFHLTEVLRIDLGGSYIHARLTEDAPGLGAKAGATLPGSPEINGNLGLQYDFDIAGHAAFVRADAIHIAAFHNNIVRLPHSEAGGYSKLDASARVTIRDINMDLYVRNLTNEDAFTSRSGGPYFEFYGNRLRPRTIGVQFSYEF